MSLLSLGKFALKLRSQLYPVALDQPTLGDVVEILAEAEPASAIDGIGEREQSQVLVPGAGIRGEYLTECDAAHLP